MKLWRVAAVAALISTFTLLSASAVVVPVSGRWSPIPNSAVPSEGPVTTLVRGDPPEMIVRWNCGQPSSCSYTGAQGMLNPVTVIMIVPSDIGAPGRIFYFGTHNNCAAYGADAQIGVWLTSGGEAIVQQCFLPTQSRYTASRDRPPLVRVPRLQLPSNIGEMMAAADARERARRQRTP